jgi:hypothetical protein
MLRPRFVQKVLMGVAAVFFLGLIFSVQFFLSFRTQSPQTVSDDVTERSRIFVEQIKQGLQEQQSSTEQSQ